MKKFLLCVVALLSSHVMHAQYFCSEEGTELRYVNYDGAGQGISDENITVTNVSKEGNMLKACYFDKIVTTKVKDNTTYTLYNWSYDGEKTVCAEDLMYGPYIDSDSDPQGYNEQARMRMLDEKKFNGDNSWSLADDAAAGSSLPDRFYEYVPKMLKTEVTISGGSCLGTEQVSTTAGKFDCIKISYLKRTKVVLKTTTVRVTEWYAKGVGLVKSESFDLKGKPAGKTLLVKITNK